MITEEPLFDLEVVQSDVKTITLNFKDSTGNPIDISGFVLFFTAKNILSDLDSAAVLKKTIICPSDSNSTSGIGLIAFSSTDTNIAIGNYPYDIKYQKNSGVSIIDRKTIAIGNFRVNATGTQRTS